MPTDVQKKPKIIMVETLRARYPAAFLEKDAYHASDRDYHHEIRSLEEKIKGLMNPTQEEIVTATHEWWSGLTKTQRNRDS